MSTDIVFKQLRYNQRSGTECGVFAATNAITLMLGKDPSTRILKYAMNVTKKQNI